MGYARQHHSAVRCDRLMLGVAAGGASAVLFDGKIQAAAVNFGVIGAFLGLLVALLISAARHVRKTLHRPR